MTEKELSKYYHLKKEIEDLEERIKKLGDGVGSIELTDMPKGNKKIISIQEKIAELKDIYVEARISALEEYLRIEAFINNIEDTEIKQIMRYRFMDLKKWNEIDKLMHCGKDYSKKKYYNYKNKIYPTLSH